MPVNWCPALGTVLANEEVVDGVSERGGHPVIRKVCSLFYHLGLLNALLTLLLPLFSFIQWLYDFTVHCLLPSSLCGSGC